MKGGILNMNSLLEHPKWKGWHYLETKRYLATLIPQLNMS